MNEGLKIPCDECYTRDQCVRDISRSLACKTYQEYIECHNRKIEKFGGMI